MQTATTIEEIRTRLRKPREAGLSVGFVPTMGALHEGHLSLLQCSARENDINVLSIFVNPTQFGPNEDYASYPRALETDLEKAKACRTDITFLPSVEEIYPAGASTFVVEEMVSQPLCGAFRPGHFRGVCTVVLKLLQIIEPDRLYLGQKDGQQLRVIEKMVDDLNVNVGVVGCPTLREPDGLAMSSRNRYLSPEERTRATLLFQGLQQTEKLFSQGERAATILLSTAAEMLAHEPKLQVQYLELRRWRDLQTVENTVEEKSILAVAAHIGTTRLIDNVFLTP